jgi:hypothetical protein
MLSTVDPLYKTGGVSTLAHVTSEIGMYLIFLTPIIMQTIYAAINIQGVAKK